MPEQALYLKWRPVSFEDMVGQEHVVRTLRNSLRSGRIRHAYLFSGPRGTGKTTMARLLAKAVNCLDPAPDRRPCNACRACAAVNEGRYLDLIEIDAATHTGVDDVRDLREKIAFAPGEGRYKVYVIDEVHRFSGNAFDALLKTLEEPPEHAIFVLATTEIDKVPATIKSRCLQFEFRRLSVQEMTDRLALIAAADGLKIEREALEVIARQGAGCMRDSISLLDQIVADPAETITLELVQRILGTANVRAVKELVEALIERQVGRGLHIINAAIDAGSDPRQFGQQVVDHLRAVLLAQTASADLVEASAEERALYERQAGQISRSALLTAIRAFNDAVNSYKGGWQPQLSLELALIDSLRAPEDDDLSSQQPGGAQQTGPTQAAPQPEPEIEATPPGSPPVISPAVIREGWNHMLKVLRQRNPTGPDVVKMFQVQRVDGNVVFLSTDNPLYYDRMQHPKKLGQLERVFHEVYRLPLRIKLVMGPGAEAAGRDPAAVDDPLISEAMELGGQVRYDEEEGDS